MTVATTSLPGSSPASCAARASAARTWSPSMTRPLASAKMARSASPSSATPASASCSTTARATTSGDITPQPSLMFEPVGPVVDRDHLGAEATQHLRPQRRRAPVRAVHDDPHPVQLARGRLLQVTQVPLLRARPRT